jgi:2-dehydro-3-deoxygluconokinase
MTGNARPVVTFGESMVLLSSPEIGLLRHAPSLRVGVAGAESNLAIGVVRLGVPAHWIGRIGDDEFGELVAMTLRGQGVATKAIVDPGRPTGMIIKERRTSASTRVWYRRAGSAGSRLRPDDLDPDVLQGAGVLHVTGITPALGGSAYAAVRTGVELAREARVPVSFDLNYRAALWSSSEAAPVLKELIGQADIVFATEDEARLVSDGNGPAELAAALAQLGPSQVAIKLGERGAVVRVDGTTHEVPAEPVVMIDPVGAGDAFAAGYLAELWRGTDTNTRLRTAARAGAFAVAVSGDWEGLPTVCELGADRADDVRR